MGRFRKEIKRWPQKKKYVQERRGEEMFKEERRGEERRKGDQSGYTTY